MENITNWTQLFFESLSTFGQKFMGAIPGILGALFILLVGWIFCKIVSSAVTRLLKALKFDVLSEKIKANELIAKANIQLKPSAIVGKFVYWVLLLLVFITASETMGWNAVSNEISKLISYLPTLLSAIVIFIIGVYIATFVRDVIAGTTLSMGISSGKMISGFVFYVLFIIVSLTALDQAGIDTSIITSNLLIILGAILAAGSISYGFASRTILANILAAFFSKSTFEPGQIIQLEDITGEIIQQNKISITVRNDKGEKIVIPTQDLISNRVKILDKALKAP